MICVCVLEDSVDDECHRLLSREKESVQYNAVGRSFDQRSAKTLECNKFRDEDQNRPYEIYLTIIIDRTILLSPRYTIITGASFLHSQSEVAMNFFRFVQKLLLVLLTLSPGLYSQEKPAINVHENHPPGQGQSGYKILDTITIGGEGGWDYLVADSEGHRVFVSHGTHVQVVNLPTKTIAGDITPTPGVHGIAIIPRERVGYISNGRDSSVTVFDFNELQILDNIKIEASNPDAILYDPFSQRVFTFNGRSSNATAIDIATNKVLGNIPLPGKPEFAVSDYLGKIYVNIEDKSEVVEIDPKTLKVLATWPIKPGEEPSGLAIDRANRRLFSVCGNKHMIVLDADSGKVVADLPIGDGVDAAAYDPSAHLVFSSNGEGTLTIVQQKDKDTYTVLDNLRTERGARTMALDESTHRIYLSTASFGPPPAPTPDRPNPRPSIIPGTFRLLVVGPH